ncbi:BC1872 family protein [Fictibacillus gelatini]|uniref:BC1872 family protein n=1 Tax=Fictibacillus gelatini TaxID=225985 RepID=UPI0006885B72|nr:hypothetical protein [Fictibacillus gelatini]
MRAGKELDALIAEKVMGWVSRTDKNEFAWWASDNSDIPKWFTSQRNFRPSTNISDAWLVVEWLESNIGGISLESHCDEKRYDFRVFNGSDLIAGRAETAPLAICLAALKCVEGGNANE